MIQINVLPERYRKSERTSPRLFAAMLLCVVFVSGSLGWLGLAYFGDLGEREVELAQLEEQIQSRQESVTRHGQLGSERADYQQREQTIREISESRMLWTPIVDELVDLASAADGERHSVWFKNMTISSPKQGKNKEGPRLRLPGAVQGDSLEYVVNWREDMSQAAFSTFVETESELMARTESNPERQPAQSEEFDYELVFQSAKERAKTREALKKIREAR